MKQKLTLRIPNQSGWPSQYWGQTVAVEVVNVKFPDGGGWYCEGDQYQAEFVFDEQPKTTQQSGSTLIAAIGEKPTKLTIEF
jgi:hypothetical protein